MLEMKEKSEDDKLEECFESKSLFAKSFIIAAGPLANFILAGLVYWIVFLLGSIGPIPILEIFRTIRLLTVPGLIRETRF